MAFYLEDSGSKAIFAWEGMAEECRRSWRGAGRRRAISVIPGEFERMWGRRRPTTPPRRSPPTTPPSCDPLHLRDHGQPKGAELSHANIQGNGSGRDLDWTIADDVIFGGLPLFHSFGQTAELNTCGMAAALTLISRFYPAKALKIFERDRVTII